MNKRLLLPLLCIVFAPGTSQAQVQKVPVAITWDYYAQPKTLIVRALNSGKDITGYTVTIRHKNPDGTLDKGGWTETTSDMLGVLVAIQLAKDPAAEERMHGERNDGLFVAGTTRDTTLNGVNDGSALVAVADVVFYADSTFDEQNEDVSLAKTRAVLSFTPLTMLQASAQAVDFKVGRHFGEGQESASPCAARTERAGAC